MRKTVNPEQHPDEHGKGYYETHPAYGMIRAQRVSGHGYLYGSDFAHRDYVKITISASELKRDLSQDWAHERNILCELSLSEAQWARFVSTLNAQATQCTLEFVNGIGELPEIPAPPSRKEQFAEEMKEHLAIAQRAAGEILAMAKASGPVSKKELWNKIHDVINNLTPNSEFIAKQFGEHIETTVEHAKIEVNAYITNAISRAGLAALKAPIEPIALEDKRDAGV